MNSNQTNAGTAFTFAASTILSGWVLFTTCTVLIFLTVPIFEAAFDRSVARLEHPGLVLLLFDLASYPTYSSVAAVALATVIAYVALSLARTHPRSMVAFAGTINCFLVLFILGATYAGSKAVGNAIELNEAFYLYSTDDVSPEEFSEYWIPPDGVDRHGNSLLAVSILCRKDIVLTKALIEDDAQQVHQRNNEGATPLILAIKNEADPDVIGLLLESGADVHQEDNNDRSALDYAEELGNSEILTMLQKH